MQDTGTPHPPTLHRLEWIFIALATAVCLALGAYGLHRMNRKLYQEFLERAPRVQAALERFAADHRGCFPGDAGPTQRPPGLSDRYIKWQKEWKLDYEAKPDGQGGYYVCLEFGGPYRRDHYYKLCENPKLRRLYGRGQPIPRQRNRIWVVREKARIRGQNCP